MGASSKLLEKWHRMAIEAKRTHKKKADMILRKLISNLNAPHDERIMEKNFGAIILTRQQLMETIAPPDRSTGVHSVANMLPILIDIRYFFFFFVKRFFKLIGEVLGKRIGNSSIVLNETSLIQMFLENIRPSISPACMPSCLCANDGGEKWVARLLNNSMK